MPRPDQRSTDIIERNIARARDLRSETLAETFGDAAVRSLIRRLTQGWRRVAQSLASIRPGGITFRQSRPTPRGC